MLIEKIVVKRESIEGKKINSESEEAGIDEQLEEKRDRGRFRVGCFTF